LINARLAERNWFWERSQSRSTACTVYSRHATSKLD